MIEKNLKNSRQVKTKKIIIKNYSFLVKNKKTRITKIKQIKKV